MPHVTTDDGVRLYYEETGSGAPIVFVHEFADDYRSFEPQIRYFARRYRCVAYNARGYPPSDVPEDPASYSQERARDDIRAVLDGLAIAKAHVVGVSMGGFATLHFGLAYPVRALSLIVAGCGYGAEPEFTLGIEEEYFLVDRATRDVVGDPPPEMLQECEALLAGQVSPEFLRSQIEIGTRVCSSLADARTNLRQLRATVAAVAERYGLAPIAAGTHPFARWGAQKTTERGRYASLHDDLQAVGRRLAICGLHVHIGIPDDELRIDLLNQASYFLPHLLALSTSSPFWEGENTGLKSYRLAVFDELPRTGTPERFASWGEYRRHVDILVGAGLIEDATKLWWDLRPSARFPTLEMRVTDSCTMLDDALSIAALFRCLLRMLWRLKRDNQRWRIYARMLIDENRWRAQRYGFDQGLVDFGRGAIFPYAELLDEMLVLVDPDARHFGCLDEISHAREILARGTSAHRQLAIFDRAIADGATRAEALCAVVDWLITETGLGL